MLCKFYLKYNFDTKKDPFLPNICQIATHWDTRISKNQPIGILKPLNFNPFGRHICTNSNRIRGSSPTPGRARASHLKHRHPCRSIHNLVHHIMLHILTSPLQHLINILCHNYLVFWHKSSKMNSLKRHHAWGYPNW